MVAVSDTKYLTEKNGLWFFNWRVPKDSRELFGGKTYVKKSLQTHNLREARYKRNQMLAEVEQVIQGHRHEGNDAELYRANIAALLSSTQSDLEGSYDSLTMKLESLSSDVEIDPDVSHLADQWPVMNEAERNKATRDAYLAALVELIPNKVEQIQAKALQNVYLGVQHELEATSIKDALDLHVRDNSDRLKAKTITQTKKAASVFLEYLAKADFPLASIGRRMVKDFIADQKTQKGGATVEGYVSYLSSIWKHALDLELVDGSNPFQGHKIEAKKDSYQMFSDEQLDQIFSLTKEYRGDPKQGFKYLIPRLGYVTGCRIEEICSLTCEQVITDEETGITYLEIRDGKTVNAQRKIPVHDWILDDLIAQCEASGSGLVFPVMANKRTDGKYSDKMSKWFTRFKKKMGITQRNRSFHSFRVHMATNLERGGVLESTTVWILGHARTQSLSYGLYSKGMDLEPLKEAVSMIPVAEGW